MELNPGGKDRSRSLRGGEYLHKTVISVGAAQVKSSSGRGPGGVMGPQELFDQDGLGRGVRFPR